MRLIRAIRGSYGALQILYRISGFLNLFCKRFDKAENRALRRSAALPDGPLNGQDTGALAGLPFGAWRMGCNGCEVIAAYNAMLALGRRRPLAEIADELEKGVLFNGFGGTNLGALTAFFRRSGIGVRVLRRGQRACYDEALRSADGAVLSYWTGKTLRRSDGSWNSLHTVFLQRRPWGIRVWNAYSRSAAPAEAASIASFLEEYNSDPVCLLLLGEKAVDKEDRTGYNTRRTTR